MSVKAYKGFNKDMTCRGFQFKEGETYHEDEAKLCEKGFHACLDPLDCFRYYAPAQSIFHEVELDELTDEKSDDSKICGKTLKVSAKLDIAGIVKAKFEYNRSKCEKELIIGGYGSAVSGGDESAVSGGYRSAVSGGDRSAVSGGDRSAVSGGDGSAVSGGDRSAVSGGDGSAVSGGDGSAVSGGYKSVVSGGDGSIVVTFNGKAKAGMNSVIALANREWNGDKYDITDFAAAIVDGKKIKPDTWYTLKDGEFVEVGENDEET